MLEIILARHGQTKWNKDEIFRGRADVGLNETGRRQAEALAGYLAGEKIDIVYASPLQRAVKTAEPIAQQQGLKVNAIENLIDFDFGEWQGLARREIEVKYPELYRDWLDTPEQVRIPGGESLESVRRRVVPFIEEAAARCGEGRIIFVSHRVVLKVIVCTLLGLDNASFWNIRLDTAAIARFTVDGGRTVLTSFNDTSYLKAVNGGKLADF